MKQQSTKSRLVAVNFRIPLELRRRLKILAATRSITMTNLLLELLELLERLDREEWPSSVKKD